MDPLYRLPFASNALFNASCKQYDSNCLPETRVEVLEEIYEWVDGADKSCIFWLSGWSKSAIARTVGRHYDEKGRLAASFFFSRGDGDSSHAGKFVTTIVRQLFDNQTLDLQQHICHALTRHSQILEQSVQDQWAQLVLYPLSMCTKGSLAGAFLLVLDALDECADRRTTATLISLLPLVGDLLNVRIRILVTSRPEKEIMHSFDRMHIAAYKELLLHRISSEASDRDIRAFLEHHYSNISTTEVSSGSRPDNHTLTAMAQYAQGLFIWAETACRYLQEDVRFAQRRPGDLMKRDNNSPATPGAHLNDIYTAIITASVPMGASDREREQACSYLTLVLGGIAILFSTVSVVALSKLLALSIDEVSQTIAGLQSILDVPKNINHPLRLHHDSFRTFLLDDSRCQQPSLQVNGRHLHAKLATNCIRMMSSLLKTDVCRRNAPGALRSELSKDEIQKCLPPEIQYACLYWVQHAMMSEQQPMDGGIIHRFLREHTLHWVEAMGWMGTLPEAVGAMTLLEARTKVGSWRAQWLL